MIHTIPEDYKEDAKGNLVPIANIRDIDLLRDQEVKELMVKAKAMHESLRAFQTMAYATVAAFVALSAERYGAKVGGKKGNITLTSFDGRQKVQIAVSDCLSFDERLVAAKTLIDECIAEWSVGANENLRAIVDSAFAADKAGNIDTYRILALRRLHIDDKRWQQAMDAISDSIKVTDSKHFIRFYERPSSDKKFAAISLDIASL